MNLNTNTCHPIQEQASSNTPSGFHSETPRVLRILRLKQVLNRVSISRSLLYSLIKQKKFPRNFCLAPGGRSVGWLEGDVEAWVKSRAVTSCHRDLKGE